MLAKCRAPFTSIADPRRSGNTALRNPGASSDCRHDGRQVYTAVVQRGRPAHRPPRRDPSRRDVEGKSPPVSVNAEDPKAPLLPSLTAAAANASAAEKTAVGVLLAISAAHMLNDAVQSLIPAIYPILKDNYQLDFFQIGLISLAFQLTASLLQPFVGMFTDKHPQPYATAVGMAFTLTGLVWLAYAHSFFALMAAVAVIGIGSSVFHPDSARMARAASGGRHGLAQSVFQVGGNVGQAIGPLLAAFIILPLGQDSVAWLALLPLAAMVLLARIGAWYAAKRRAIAARGGLKAVVGHAFSSAKVRWIIFVLAALVFSKFVYSVSLGNYLTFYLMDKFALSVQEAQLYLFLFLGANAVGGMIGGPMGDRVGRRLIIWVSVLGAIPFALLLPYADLFWTATLSVIIALIISSSFSSIVVYAQELVPGRVGAINGLFFGLSFGLSGLGAAALGWLADETSIGFVYQAVAFLPLLGLVCVLLPNIERGYPVR
jgi:FSR family fosmidomycin resistance protein-like MFS transporter